MSFQRRAASFDLARRGVVRFIPEASEAGASGFAYSDIPNQLLRFNSLEGSLAFSGAVLTGVTDVSPAGETVTVTGSPVYTASDAGLNGAPSFTAPRVEAPNITRASIKFVAAVVRMSTGQEYIMDGLTSSDRLWMIRTTGGDLQVAPSGSFALGGGEPTTGRKRVLAAMDGSGGTTWNGGASIGTFPNNVVASTGIVVGARSNGATPAAACSFYMACSSVPSAPLLAALEAKLLTDFG